jgi:hypothetical protein
LAKEYHDNNKPVLFIEQYVRAPVYPIRYYRWWAAYNESSAYYPLIMVDSGDQISTGPVDYSERFASMVDTALLRPPTCSIKATSQRIADHFHFDIQITNLSGMTLSISNSATIHAILYEINATNVVQSTAGVTGTYVRAGTSLSIYSLENGVTDQFSLDTPDLTSVDNWQNVYSLIIVDYNPGTKGAYDTLQVAFEVQEQTLLVPTLQQLLLID